MAFNGSGVFSRLYNWGNDAAASIKIRADRMDAEMDGMAVGLSTCITKDGQTTITANLPMATYRHTNVGNAVNRTDYAAAGQVQDGKINWVDGGGTADAITASYAIPITALVDGQICFVRATAANATTTPTFSPSGLTARTIVRQGGTALLVGDIKADGHELILRYDLSNTRWELLNPAQIVFGNLDSSAIASEAEAEAGTATNKLMTPERTAQAVAALSAPSGIPEARAVSGTLTFEAADNGKFVRHPAADTTARTWTIDSHANLALVVGTCITIVNENGAGALTIAITSDTLRLAGPGTTGSRTVAANGVATILKVSNTLWYISGSGVS